MIDKLNEILIGIDQDECDNKNDGWWETSTGAKFGAKKLKEVQDLLKKITLTDVGNCQFEAYATFCIECDRKGMKPLKYKDYLKIGRYQ